MADPSPVTTSSESRHVERLERNVLTFPNGIALAAAAMAPVIAVVLNAPAAGPSAGAALPLSFLLAFIACLLVGNSVIQFARKLPAAGSFYTFNSHGLGKTAGFSPAGSSGLAMPSWPPVSLRLWVPSRTTMSSTSSR